MGQFDSLPKAGGIFSGGFDVTVVPPHGENVQARVLDLGLRTIVLAVEDPAPLRRHYKGVVQVHVKLPLLSMPIEALCKVQDLAEDQRQWRISLDVMDWIGLREQLPVDMRKFLSLREVDRFQPAGDERFEVTVTPLGQGAPWTAPVCDLSLYGLSVATPEGWPRRLERGDQVELRFSLPGDPEVLEFVGFVRHVSRLGAAYKVGVLFDANLTSEFMLKQLRLLRFLDRDVPDAALPDAG